MEAELIRKIFELSLTMGARETSKELAKQGIKISHRQISNILLKTYPDDVVPLEIQKLSKEARQKRKRPSINKNSETFKTLRAALIKCIIQKRELQREILRLRTSNEALNARISELEAELEERKWSEENLW
ncbi:hypothetical protein J7M02_04000 [Candidatus Aerophobetes bacterium]|nr:hypothetical protein [Candidatus Aerophobetes bacterium]